MRTGEELDGDFFCFEVLIGEDLDGDFFEFFGDFFLAGVLLLCTRTDGTSDAIAQDSGG